MSSEIYACNGGGGGAGFGNNPTVTFGGLANPYICADDVKKAHDGYSSTEDSPGPGGNGTNMNNHDEGDDTKGGNGAKGGMCTNYAGIPAIVHSSVLEERSGDTEQFSGRNAAIEEFYPNDECTIECIGGYVGEGTDGIPTYAVKEPPEEGPWYKPNFTRTHFPTGKVLSEIIPADKLSYRIIDYTDKHQLIEASYTQPDDISNVVLTTKYCVVKEILITVDDDSYVNVSKVYDGTTTLNNAVFDNQIKITVPEQYENKVNVKPEYKEFTTANVGTGTQNLNLIVEIKSGSEIKYPVYLSQTTIEATYEITKLYTDVADVTIPPREYRPNNSKATITNIEFEYDTDKQIVLPEDAYEIVKSEITDESCDVGDHNVEYTIELKNSNNASFGTESEQSQEVTKTNKTITILKAGIGLHSVKATNRAFKKDNYFVEAKTAYFINLSDEETFTYGTDYKIYVDSESEHSDQAKITDNNCDAGDHDISCKVKLLNANYQFTDGTSEVDVASKVKINKKYIQLASAKAENRQYAFNDFDVDINDVEFSGLSAGEELVRDTDYTVPVARIIDETENVGTHNVAYQVELTNSVKNYTFGLNGASAVGTSSVEISKREIGIDSVEFETVESSTGDISVKVKNIHFSNLNEGVTFTENVDYVVNSCIIEDGLGTNGMHTVKYQIELKNRNYTFSEGSTFDGEAQVEIITPNSNITQTGDNTLIIVLPFLIVAFALAFTLKRTSKFSC